LNAIQHLLDVRELAYNEKGDLYLVNEQ
jgi:hypothetical protein